MFKRVSLVLLVIGGLVGCESRSDVVAPPFNDQSAADSSFFGDVAGSPYKAMSTPELREAIASVGGQAFINFKPVGAARGVDRRGRMLISRQALAQAKNQVRALGLEFDREYELVPAVVATIPPELVERIRKLPFVESVEPVATGERAAEVVPWQVEHVRGDTAWTESRGSGVKVLIIDSGVMNGHEDLNVAATKRSVLGIQRMTNTVTAHSWQA